MVFLVIFLSVVAFWSFVYILRLKGDVRKIKASLQKIKGTDTNIRLTTSTFDRDITGLILEVNEILNQQQEILINSERVNRKFLQGITNISHDLRTPLTSASGYIELIKSKNLDDKKRFEYLEIVQNRLMVLAHLMNELFDYTQIVEGKTDLKLESVDVCSLIRDELASFYDILTQAGFEVVVDIPNQVIMLITDPANLRRIVWNLMSNMAKHGVEFFRVKVNSDGVMTFTNKVANANELEVERLFERFYTSDTSRTSQKTGLGLAITKALVEKMGGEIHAWLDGNMLNIKVDMKA